MENIRLQEKITYMNLTRFCGDEGFEVWNKERNDIGLCFQQIILDIPALSILTIFSSYYFGLHQNFVVRGSIQLLSLNMRCFLTILLAIMPLLQIYTFFFKTDESIPQVAYFLSAIRGIAWFVHFFYNVGLRKKLGRSPRGPTIIMVIWSFVFVLTIISVRSHYLILKYATFTPYSMHLAYGISICYLIIQLFYAITLIPGDQNTVELNIVESGESQPLLSNAYVRFSEEGDPSYLGIAMENTKWYSKLVFAWVESLMQKGIKGQLSNTEDLYDLPLNLSCSVISSELDNALQSVESPLEETIRSNVPQDENDVRIRKSNFSLLKSLHKVFWFEFYSVGILKFIGDCANFAGPILLNKLINFIESDNRDVKFGYLYAGGLLCTSLIAALCDSHFNFLISMVGFRMRGALITTIYRKTLSVSSLTLKSHFSIGEIVNFMSTDTDRIVNACPSFHSLWNIPFQLAITLYLLYNQVGISFFAGVLFSIILIPINKIIANKIANLSAKLMTKKDARVKMITEIIKGIKAVKLYVWEEHFIHEITCLRSQELKYLKSRKYLDALCVYFWATTPVLIAIFTFTTYVLLGNKLTAATVFTSIALLNMLIAPLNAFPWVLNGMMEAWVSIKRIQRLIEIPDLNLLTYYSHNFNKEPYDIIIGNANFNYCNELTAEEKLALHNLQNDTTRISKKGKGIGKGKTVSFEIDEFGKFYLKSINMKIKKGDFIGIIGPVGCGKSSILKAILAELSMHSGSISISQIESGFGYVSQQPWLQRGTLRDNILFGKSFDERKYKEVLFACGLIDDINILPKRDMTGVGESGMTLSGGQKARVALARAIYQDKDVYLLDDILSAVDAKVAKHILQHCILDLLANKTIILCTHHVQYLIYAHKIIVMDKGIIQKEDVPTEILSPTDYSLAIDLELDESCNSTSTTTNSLLDGFQNTVSLYSIKENDNDDDQDSVLNQEISQKGGLDFHVYLSYWKSVGHLLCLSILIAIVFMQISRNMTDWWLAHWVTETGGNQTNSTNLTIHLDDWIHDSQYSTNFYLKIYILFALLNSVFTLFRAFLFAYGGIVAAAKFHKLLLKSVIKGKCSFFDITPLGRILNRFSSDTYTIDDSLPFVLNILLAQFFGLLGSIAITIYGLPWICLLLVPLIPIYHWLQNYYRLTSRELKRITSVTLSPVYSHFNETLQGLTTINAFRARQRFKRENQEYVDANIKAQFASQVAARWLGLRLQFIGVAIVGGVSFIAVIQHQYAVADPGLIGLVISYALTVTGLLGGVINTFTETEQEMIAVERVNEYTKKIPLENKHLLTIHPPFSWPSHGVISFNNVVLRYRANLNPSLNGISFETRPAEKIGVVGRTGAGKSSIISALFRITEISSGEIFIDSVNIATLALSALRSRLFCIPQDPFLFSGNLRENLDPLKEFRDDELWNALTKVNFDYTIRNMGGLESVVDEGGANFSVGQRQLICLARAVLHNAKILCIDEATANIDHDTDRQVQQTLRSVFRKCTVLTIAHRIQTVLDSDRVLVMHEGRIIEFDTPDNLLFDSNSKFYEFVHQDN